MDLEQRISPGRVYQVGDVFHTYVGIGLTQAMREDGWTVSMSLMYHQRYLCSTRDREQAEARATALGRPIEVLELTTGDQAPQANE